MDREILNIVHIAANAPYNDYWGYQENLLPKYHRKMGHNVVMITTNKTFKDGVIIDTNIDDYCLNDGTRIIRREYIKYPTKKITGLLSYIPVYDILNEIKPDFIFFHALISWSIMDVLHYIQNNSNVIVVQDNHMDYNIGNQTKTIMNKIVRGWYRFLNRKSINYVSKIYGVTPWRKKYVIDYFGIPEEKTDVLIMGADDDYLDLTNKSTIRLNMRQSYNISDEDFLVVTGGKIDLRKKIDVLVEACSEMPDIKLLVFGKVSDEVAEKFFKTINNYDNLIYVGWIDSNKVYDYFFAADLVFFPGQHSVLWEQACASKVPCVFEKWDGMGHVNNGGNALLLTPITKDNIKNSIRELKYTSKYYAMKSVAESEKTNIYRYSTIAEKSLECYYKNAKEIINDNCSNSYI